ncbi:MAG: DUF1810 domain-containing protein [Bacteroidales bacterium]|nr:DUF1810 domain-containing protein [Bacteroidales bacterium]
MSKYNIERFLEAQNKPNSGYSQALQEIKNGEKVGHWIWYIFPQLKSLGFSDIAKFYGIENREEAEEYLKNSILNQRIHEISETLLTHSNKSALEILGRPDDLKVCSSMTLFNIISPNDIFAKVLEVFYQGKGCEKTISEICSKK